MDNIFIEQLWRSLKQEAVYLEELADGFKARSVIKTWITFTIPSAHILRFDTESRTKHMGLVKKKN